jgi:hypothetical protein
MRTPLLVQTALWPGGPSVDFWLLRHDPALLAARLAAPLRRDQLRWDRLFLLTAAVAFIGWLGLIGRALYRP